MGTRHWKAAIRRSDKVVAFQIMLGLEVMHRCDVLHRDLSIRNLYFEEATSDVFIADFGLSRAKHDANEEGTIDIVTLPYRSPEVALKGGNAVGKYHSPPDVWSAGCVVAEVLR